jgi:nucleotide-binding universal stress UspA family protein
MHAKKKEESILVPVDFSEHSEAALLLAAEFANKLGFSLIVLHVVHDLGEAPGYYSVKGHNKILRRMEDVAKDMMDAFMVKMVKKHPEYSSLKTASTLLVVGLPVNRILEIAKKSRARMIFMGSQGRTGLSHVLLGSKAEQVMRLSPIPVTIVKKDNKKQ